MLITIFKSVVFLSIASSFTIILLFIIRKALKNRLPNRLALLLWIPVMLQLVNPFIPEIAFPKLAPVNDVIQFVGSILPKDTPSISVNKTQGHQVVNDLQKDESVQEPRNMPGNSPNTVVSYDGVKTVTVWGKMIDTLPWIWLVGVLFFLSKLLTGYLLFLCSTKKNKLEIADYETIIALKRLCKRLSIHKQVRLYYHGKIRTPMLIGLGKPMILLPLEEYSDDELSFILAHELSHCKNNDLAFKWVGELIRCIHWFNPLVYLAVDTMGRDCELCCDEQVVRITGDYTAYGNTLISMAGKRNKLAFPANTMWESRKNMRKRIVNLARINKVPRFKKMSSVIYVTLLTGFIIIGMAACNWTVEQDTSSPNSTIDKSPNVTQHTTETASQQSSSIVKRNTSLEGNNSDKREITSEKERQTYYGKYFAPIDIITSIVDNSWNSPEQVDAQEIFMFFIANSGENRGLSLMDGKQVESFFDKAEKTYKFPASVYEPIVQKYFNASSEHLKTAKSYNKRSNTYDIMRIMGGGGGRYYKVKKVSVNGTVATITVVYYQDIENKTPTRTVTLTVRNKGNSFEYLSCKVIEN